jgi:hypothetical protein
MAAVMSIAICGDAWAGAKKSKPAKSSHATSTSGSTQSAPSGAPDPGHYQ